MTDTKHPPTLGDLLIKHLAKIVIGLGAVLAFVWQVSGVASDLQSGVTGVETDIAEVKKDLERHEKQLDRLRFYNRKPGVK